MTAYNNQKESPWAILDPSLNIWQPSSPFSKPSSLEFPIDLYSYQQAHCIPVVQGAQISISDPEEETDTNSDDVDVEACLKVLQEMDDELLYHRNTIYVEKLKGFEEELLAIQNETHRDIVRQDKKFEKKRDAEIARKQLMYEYELDAIEKQYIYEKSHILQDIKQKAGFARKVITSEVINQGTTNVSNGSKKRKEKSSSSDEEEDQGFKRIHLQQKMGKLQAIFDRQRAAKSKNSLDDALYVAEQSELDADFVSMKKAISK